MSGQATARSTRSSAESRHHHGSHHHLLNQAIPAPRGSSQVDAIVVPTAREPAIMGEAIRLAARLGCPLVALCSRRSSADEVAGIAAAAGIELIAIDTARLPRDLLPRFATRRLLAETVFERRTDTSIKRNLGLLLAQLIGWQRIVFLDDDILVPEPNDLCDAARSLNSYDAVGLWIDGYPDNSVVCHAYREAGGSQDTFIGGGALAVGSTAMTSFFPCVYNEDWFFLLDTTGLSPSAIRGRVIQWPYDPYTDQQRARSEEFGDCLAEGIFSLLDDGGRIHDADHGYWAHFLVERRQFIADIVDMVGVLDRDGEEKRRMVGALEAARELNELMTAQLCVDFLQAWQADRERWRQHVSTVRGGRAEPEKVLARLRLRNCSRYVAR